MSLSEDIILELQYFQLDEGNLIQIQEKSKKERDISKSILSKNIILELQYFQLDEGDLIQRQEKSKEERKNNL